MSLLSLHIQRKVVHLLKSLRKSVAKAGKMCVQLEGLPFSHPSQQPYLFSFSSIHLILSAGIFTNLFTDPFGFSFPVALCSSWKSHTLPLSCPFLAHAPSSFSKRPVKKWSSSCWALALLYSCNAILLRCEIQQGREGQGTVTVPLCSEKQSVVSWCWSRAAGGCGAQALEPCLSSSIRAAVGASVNSRQVWCHNRRF